MLIAPRSVGGVRIGLSLGRRDVSRAKEEGDEGVWGVSDEETRVGEVGCAQRTLKRTSGQERMAGRRVAWQQDK